MNRQDYFPNQYLLDIEQVCHLLNMSRASFCNISEKDPSFPEPFCFEGIFKRYLKAELFGWLEAKRSISEYGASNVETN